jgi:CRISPR-associated protein Csx10
MNHVPSLPKNQFTAIVIMKSDWHIGSGAGITGDIDSLVQRDNDKLPYIPAKTLTGVWRDACELVALGLDNGVENGAWHKWVNYLFGEQPALAQQAIETPPRPAALSVRPAYLPKNLREILNNKSDLKNAVTFVKPGISIDPKSGCAIKDFLRFEEMVRGEAILEAECELNLPKDEDQKRTAYALLVAGTKFVERLGGKRRRGVGKCQLVIEQDIEPWINWLETHPEPPSVPDSFEKEQVATTEYFSGSQDKTWLEVKLRITAKSPVILAKRTVGNVVETLDYIPGSHLLPLIRKQLSYLGVDINRAIAHNDIVVTNATLQVDNQKGRPIPLSLFYEKLGGGLDKGGRVYNRLVESEPKEQQVKGYREGYIASPNGSHLPQYAKVNLTIGTHNTIKDEYQRPTSDLGGVYSYEAIQTGTILQAEIKLSETLADALKRSKKEWWKSLEEKKQNHRVGVSKKDDYGAVSLEVISPPKKIETNLQSKDSQLTVWLLSDVLLRDERLRPTTDIKQLAQKLEEHLNVKLAVKSENISEEKKLSLIARTHRVDSWQVRWGLPRPSLVGLAAGTCVVFEVQGTLAPERLAEIQATGIGERRAEGYGQICFNDPLLTAEIPKPEPQESKEKQQHQSSGKSNPLIQDKDSPFNYARILEKAAWREAIRRASLVIASNTSGDNSRTTILGIKIEEKANTKESKPPMSQLGGLRSVLVRLQSPGDAAVITWIQHLQDTTNRADKWSPGSLDDIRELVTSPTKVWEHLASALEELKNQSFSELTLTQNGEQYLKEELWSEAVRTLVDACIRAHKRALENKPDTTQEEGEK